MSTAPSRNLVALALGMSLAACAGPEPAAERNPEETARETREEIPRDANPSPGGGDRGGGVARGASTDAEGSWESMTAQFADDFVARTAATKGYVVVFPTFLMTRATAQWAPCVIGDRIAATITRKLEGAGRRVLAGDELRDAIHASNRGLDVIRDEASAIAMAKRLSGLYHIGAVATGTINVTEGRGFSGARRVDFELRGSDVRAGSEIAHGSFRVRKPSDAAMLVEDLDRPGAWRIGERAKPFQPSVDREFEVLATVALSSLFDQKPELLLNRRVAVLPLEVNSTGKAARKLATFQRAIQAALEAAERKGKAEGAEDPLAYALDQPMKVLGEEFESGGEALATYGSRRAELYGTSAGALSVDLANTMAKRVRAITGDQVQIIPATDRRFAVSLMQADMLESKFDHSIDPGSIETVLGDSADVVVRTKIGRRIEDYVMTVRVLDLKDKVRAYTETVVLEPWMIGPIRSRLGS